MRKIFKTFLISIVSLTLVLGATNGALAKDKNATDNSKREYFDSETGLYYSNPMRVTENGLVEMDMDEFINHIKQRKEMKQQNTTKKETFKDKSSSDMSPLAVWETYDYDETLVFGTYGDPKKISANLRCDPDATSDCAITYNMQYSKSFTESYSSNVTSASEESQIQIGASFSWTEETSSGVGYDLSVPPGKEGYGQFEPYLKASRGTMTHTVHIDGQDYIDTYTVTGYSPRELSTGVADGVVYTVSWYY